MENREYKKVITYVKEWIAGGELHSGDKLPTERELADVLCVGRYSIREALRIMDALGMIESRQGSGNYLVTNIEKNLTESMELMLLIKEIDYSQISKLRRAIELYAYGCALSHLTGSQLEELAKITEDMKQTAEHEKAILDKKFHDMIIAGSDNALIISIMGSLSNVCSNLIEEVVIGSAPETERILMDIHENMLKGLMEKDLLLGMQAINQHYDLIDSQVSKP
ncbi:FadR/GntR family transcriptional regulator [Anaerocolumna xylanovorans]|uniref:GntR family transcriptional regulator, transcriptional repressor for pyruvate dehydrogenase complex n=1 Tax=Anaerocolumna xylanovorans DSM 12503 TaxID=1121345 RepID=A0A1M7XYL6_9FIRM|nr:GntR family transcriptional regulator [Anaerocolumna xylanovorans]SHO44134.1 GntR family transcriptional regulator, transcriptional repressor for pyruvate dehydrogenase complex [Anaerocolumna xylanovorans DSM 12503]